MREIAYWVRVTGRVQGVAYRAWTRGGILRHAVFKSFRQDKTPEEIGPPATRPRAAAR